MLYRIVADIVVVVHFAFVLFAVLGGLLAIKWRHIAWLHVPAFIWAGLIMFTGWICPLTPLEQWLREKGGEMAYQSGFIEHYMLPVLYPAEVTREQQISLGMLVLAINAGIYIWAWRRGSKGNT